MPFACRRNQLLGICCLALLLVPIWHRLLAPVLRPPAIDSLAPPQSAGPAGGFSMDGISFSQFQEGRKELFLTATRASSEDTDNHILLRGVEAEMFGKNGKPIRIQSREAVYDTPREEIILQNSVRIETDDFTGKTEELHYYPEAKLAETSKKFELSREGVRITGTGLNFDLGTSELVLGGAGRRVHCLLD